MSDSGESQESGGGEGRHGDESQRTDTDESHEQNGGGDQSGSHEALTQEMEREAKALEQRSDEVGKDIDETRADWESKQASDKVPGAVGTPKSEPESGSGSAPASENLPTSKEDDDDDEEGPDDRGSH